MPVCGALSVLGFCLFSRRCAHLVRLCAQHRQRQLSQNDSAGYTERGQACTECSEHGFTKQGGQGQYNGNSYGCKGNRTAAFLMAVTLGQA